MRRKITSYYYLILGLLLCSAACQKTEQIAGEGQDTYINFYNASEVLQQYRSYSEQNQIIINDSVPGARNRPQFSSTDDFRQFPRHLTGTDAVIDGPAGDIYWLPMMADTYRFTYTSVNKNYLVDTAVTLLPKTFTTQYLVESPEAEEAYRILTVPVERKGIAGKVRVQVVNLSPDFGNLEVVRVGQEGRQIATDLPGDLSFGSYSPYAELDTAGSSETYGKLVLQFRKSGSSETVLTAAIDAIPKSSHTIVFQGFERETPRRIKTGDGEYEQAIVAPNLRVKVRRVF
ncbi:DUF4397 domain-containing protein [Desertivirga xinjiangensis]|uniref:DUF4397 domain-containing protein n=1 Tax=Desertivirga xinjiangensis TaxID=539206 RepID=UPI00210D5ED1|nr:DUF4397 domain-containing protein [Pedobacter xinjiangensis]